MNLFSKLIAILLFGFPLAMLHSLESDLYVIEEDDQMALNAIESVLHVNHSDLSYYNDMDYTLVMDGHKNRKFDITYHQETYPASIISKYKQVALGDQASGISQAELYKDGCAKDEVTLHWEDRAVMTIKYQDQDFHLSYGESGLVRQINTTQSNNKELIFHLEYTDDKKIQSIIAYVDGQLDFENNYEYTEAAIAISRKQFNPSEETHVSYIIDDLAITRIEYQKNDKSKVSDMVEYIFNDQNQLVRKVSSQPGKGVTTILGFDYNEKGQLLKSSRIDASVDTILNHSESLYAYQMDTNEENNICNQKVNKIHSIYDEDGNLSSTFKESSF